MKTVRKSAPQLDGLVPYDPKYLPADVMISANENPFELDETVKLEVLSAVRQVKFNRYPDPLANDLRDMIAEANGLDRNQVILGNGGDELLFNLALAFGGPGRKMINLPPTFSVYAYNAGLTGTKVVNIPRLADYSIDEEAVLARVAEGDIDYIVITSPNNPTGKLANEEFILKLLDVSDTLVLVDEAYFEFGRSTLRPYLAMHENLLLLRTFSKAFSMAGVRMGYFLGNESVIREFMKVRQPYSVDAVSQAICRVIYKNRAVFERAVDAIIAERGRVFEALKTIPGCSPFPSDANYILFKMDNAAQVWQQLFDRSVLIRDLSSSQYTEGCLRVSIGTPEENDRFLACLREIAEENAAK